MKGGTGLFWLFAVMLALSMLLASQLLPPSRPGHSFRLRNRRVSHHGQTHLYTPPQGHHLSFHLFERSILVVTRYVVHFLFVIRYLFYQQKTIDKIK